MAVRNRDGTFRNAQQSGKISARSILARWIEEHALRLKNLGAFDSDIAMQITRIGRGELPAPELPENVVFPPNFRISRQAISKAISRALSRISDLEASEFKKIGLQRLEAANLHLQRKLQKGEPGAVLAQIALVNSETRLHGLVAPKVKASKSGVRGPNAIDDEHVDQMLGRLNRDDHLEVLRLRRKARGDDPMHFQRDRDDDEQAKS